MRGQKMLLNWSANTDPQLQVAAPPQVLRPGCLRRYESQMKWIGTLAMLLAMFGPTRAATLEDIVRPLSLQVEDSADDPSWSVADNVAGVKWLDKVPRLASPRRYARYGNMQLRSYGKASLFLTGSRDQITQFDVTVTERPRNTFDPKKTTRMLRRQFRSRTQLELIKACADSPISGAAAYKVTLVGRKPLFLVAMNDSGGNGTPNRLISVMGAHSYQSNWPCVP